MELSGPKLCLCLCSLSSSSRCSCSRCPHSRCAGSLLRGVGGGDFFPLAISSSSALHFLILERGEREEAAGGAEQVAPVAGRGATAAPAGLQLARGVESARAAAEGDEERKRSRCLPAEAAVADA